jgi:putative spermidine/putrescine transport system ATP-binding protein
VADGMCSADGRIRDVLYLGMHTRYQVALDGGGELTVVAQNLDGTSSEALAARDRPVRLIWQRKHNQVIGSASGG